MDNVPEISFRNRYGITKLRDDNYPTWSFVCQMLLSKKKVWKIVTSKHPRPKAIEEHEAELQVNKTITDAGRKKIQREVDEWDEKNDEALQIICFTILD
jgi:hypothetical protein